MESPFGAYRGGYNAMPSGWMDAATQVGRNYAQAIGAIGGAVAGGIGKFQQGKEMQQTGMQAAPTLLSQYQQVAEATGQQVDPTILERYQNIGQMSGPQVQQFNQDIAAAQQQAISLANIQRQQQAFQMQQQAAQQAMQNRAQMEQLAARREAALRATGVYASPMTMAQPSAPQPTYNPAPPAIDPYSLQPQGIPGMTINPRIR